VSQKFLASLGRVTGSGWVCSSIYFIKILGKPLYSSSLSYRCSLWTGSEERSLCAQEKAACSFETSVAGMWHIDLLHKSLLHIPMARNSHGSKVPIALLSPRQHTSAAVTRTRSGKQERPSCKKKSPVGSPTSISHRFGCMNGRDVC